MSQDQIGQPLAGGQIGAALPVGGAARRQIDPDRAFGIAVAHQVIARPAAHQTDSSPEIWRDHKPVAAPASSVSGSTTGA